MAVTAQSLINKSLRLLGVLASGETTTADEAQDSLYSLNSIIDSFSANPQYYFCTQAEQFSLVTGQNTYTIGNDPDAPFQADFVAPRPIRIVGAFIRVNNIDTPLALITEQYWTNIAAKSSSGTPTKLLYRPNIPHGQVLVYPTPSAAAWLFIKAERMVQKYDTLAFSQYLPPGYQRLLELSLAMELAPEYGSQVKPEIIANLRADLDSLIRTNIQPLPVNKTDNVPNTNTTFNMPPI
jgi:hypothetical protein